MEQKVYLKYNNELKSYLIAKTTIKELSKSKIIADIRLPQNIQTNKQGPLIGFLLGQDIDRDGEEYYSIATNYLNSLITAGANLRFLDYESPEEQVNSCNAIVLPGGNFDFPESYFIGGKNLGQGISKRFLAYQSVIMNCYHYKKPMLGICAGAQMIGAVLGKMKMYLYLTEEVSHPAKHKPTLPNEVCLHYLNLVKGSAIYKIMNLDSNKEQIIMNSRHMQAMVHENLQKKIKEKPLIKMNMYAYSAADGIPEIWGNEEYGILCVQGHPEDLAQEGDIHMQNLYKYIVKKADKYKYNLLH